MGALTERNRRELAERGYTVVPRLIDGDLAARAIAMIDGLIGAEQQAAVPPERYQAGPWPEGEPLHGTGSRLPVVLSGNHRHSVCHPICSGVTAELVSPFVELNAELLDCPPERLKLMCAQPPLRSPHLSPRPLTRLGNRRQQMYVRTDASPPPNPGHDGVPPANWHHGAPRPLASPPCSSSSITPLTG